MAQHVKELRKRFASIIEEEGELNAAAIAGSAERLADPAPQAPAAPRRESGNGVVLAVLIIVAIAVALGMLYMSRPNEEKKEEKVSAPVIDNDDPLFQPLAV